MQAQAGELDLSALGRALWRRKRWIWLPTLLVAIGATVVVNLMTPRFKSEARVLIESRETAYNRPDGERNAERDRTLVDPEAVQSQVQLALSRDLARNVVRELKFSDRAEFNPITPSPLGRVLALLHLARDGSLSIEERVLERYYERLAVYQVEKSRVIAIEFQSEDPDFAARVANAVASGYLALQQRAKQEATRQASLWLAGEIDRLRNKVADAEAKADAFRSSSNLYLGANNTSLSGQQMAELNSQLALGRSQKAEAEAKSRLLREMLRSGRPVEASEIANSELIRRLNEQRVTLRAQLAEQSSTLLPQHPRIKELKAQIGDLEGQIRSEAEKLARSFENDARIAGEKVEQLTATLDQSKRQASTLGEQDVQLRALEREAKAQRDLLESYLSRYRDASARESPDATPPDARIISAAVASSIPYFPKKLPIVLLASLATFVFTTVFIVIRELAGGRVYRPLTVSPIEAEPVVPISLGIAYEPLREPVASVTELADAEPDEPLATAPEPMAEPAVAKISREERAELAQRLKRIGPGIIVLGRATGTLAGLLPAEIGRELSLEHRVVLLDLDAEERPVVDLLPNPRAAGIGDLLSGRASFHEIIHRDRESALHLIPLGREIYDAAEVLAAPRLAIVLGALAQTYDFVLVVLGRLPEPPGAERLGRFARALVLLTGEGSSPAELSDAFAARGFADVLLFALPTDAGLPPDPGRDQAAA